MKLGVRPVHRLGCMRRAVGVEDASKFDRQAVLPPIVKKQGFGTALGFVVKQERGPMGLTWPR